MKVLNALLFSIVFLITGNALAQNRNVQICGEYSVRNITPPAPKPDTLKSYGSVRMVEPIIFHEFNGNHTLKLKWNKRFTISNSSAIPCYLLSADNSTIHGSYKIKNDTLILTYRYNIQHFSKLSPKRRVKSKYNLENRPRPVKRFARTENGEFKISNYGFWYKKEK